MNKRLYCGAAKRLITPPEEMFGDVCGMVNAEIGKVFDDLYLRVIALSDGVRKLLLVSFDLDRPIAFLVNYAVHCVVMIWNDIGDGRMGISGDIAGNVSQYMEDEYPGAVSMWTSGAAGDQNPIMMNQTYYPAQVTGESRLYPIQNAETPLMMLKILSSRHYADIKRVIESIDRALEETTVRLFKEVL